MDAAIESAVTEWDTRRVSSGYEGLRGLADEEFTGAVTEGTAWLFVLNGRIIAEIDGTLDSFEDAAATAHVAPDPSVALLYAMQTLDGTSKARYYTEETSLSAAADTLSSGNFTGYVELSENVLSGDYYLVYYGGRRLECAFVGSSEELLTGDEAFERAADEVGIYEVFDVAVEVTELPEPADEQPTVDVGTDSPASTDSADAADSNTPGVDVQSEPDGNPGGGTSAQPDEPASRGEGPQAADGDAGSATVNGDGAHTTGDAPASPSRADTGGGTDGTPDGANTRAGAGDTRDGASSVPDGAGSTPNGAGSTPNGASSTPDGPSTRDSAGETRNSSDGRGAAVADDATGATQTSGAMPAGVTDAESGDAGTKPEAGESPSQDVSAEREWQTTRTIPSLDPSESSTDGQPSENGGETGQRTTSGANRSAGSGSRTSSGGGRSASSGSRSASGGTTSSQGDTAERATRGSGQLAELKQRLEAAVEERDEAKRRVSALQSAVKEAETTADRLQSENEQLERRVEELESEVTSLEQQLESVEEYIPEGDEQREPAAALAGTNLFVRYGSKAGATLETAHAGGATREEVEQNIRIETHTDFPADRAVIEGESYEAFLHGTVEYSFVTWVVHELLYEIQETGTETAMRELFDAIPQIDRIELHGRVSVTTEEGESFDHPFDVVFRDRMGNPLIVANVTDGLNATPEPAISELIQAARDIGEVEDTLGCALHVTASFFEPDALSAVKEATGGGLLSRDKRESFLKLGRKQGFHLSLVESREGEFHVTVPEL